LHGCDSVRRHSSLTSHKTLLTAEVWDEWELRTRTWGWDREAGGEMAWGGEEK